MLEARWVIATARRSFREVRNLSLHRLLLLIVHLFQNVLDVGHRVSLCLFIIITEESWVAIIAL
jgi:hypothetical protein